MASRTKCSRLRTRKPQHIPCWWKTSEWTHRRKSSSLCERWTAFWYKWSKNIASGWVEPHNSACVWSQTLSANCVYPFSCNLVSNDHVVIINFNDRNISLKEGVRLQCYWCCNAQWKDHTYGWIILLRGELLYIYCTITIHFRQTHWWIGSGLKTC